KPSTTTPISKAVRKLKMTRLKISRPTRSVPNQLVLLGGWLALRMSTTGPACCGKGVTQGARTATSTDRSTIARPAIDRGLRENLYQPRRAESQRAARPALMRASPVAAAVDLVSGAIVNLPAWHSTECADQAVPPAGPR